MMMIKMMVKTCQPTSQISAINVSFSALFLVRLNLNLFVRYTEDGGGVCRVNVGVYLQAHTAL
jgi:hypothetical protein